MWLVYYHFFYSEGDAPEYHGLFHTEAQADAYIEKHCLNWRKPWFTEFIEIKEMTDVNSDT